MLASRACDACKLRKVKCDMADPCANCRMSQLCCAYTILPRRRGRKVRGRIPATEEQRRPTTTGVEGASSYTPRGHTLPESRGRTGLQRQGSLSRQSPRPLGLVPFTSILNLGEEPAIGFCAAAGQIREDLVTSINHALPSDAIVDVVHNCIDLFAQYLFAITPIIHEPTLRAGVSLFQPERHPQSWESSQPSSSTDPSQIWPLKTLTLITALCASVTSVIPDSFMAQRHLVSASFLKASRAMHRIYEDYDREHPDSTSLVIRIWHSTALQGITGTMHTAWHCVWEAALIAQRLRLYDEESLSQKDVIESQLLRACFWQLYAADKAACAFEDRPFVLNELLFGGDLTLLDRGEHDEALLETSKSFNQGSLESRLLASFQLKVRIWSLAGDLSMAINSHARRGKRKPMESEAVESELARLTESYLAFTGLMDDLPPWLQFFDNDGTTTDTEVLAYQKTSFWVQRSNLVTAFHCLKLVILQKCIDNNILEIMGLDNQDFSLAIRKVKIVHDFLQELQMVPFVCFKVLGEAAVIRIRRVGAILLELVETVENDTIKARSSAYLKRILDFLPKLDSKVSDKLNSV